MDVTNLTEKIYGILTVYGMRVLAAVAILILGRWVAKIIRNLIERVMTKGRLDQTLVKFVGSLSYVALMAFVVIAALNQIGIQTASFIAVLGAAGLAVGLALQGSLSNFAAGVLMIIFKPFKVGDVIEGAGVAGQVEEIQIFTTQLKTVDNKTIIVPNASVLSGNIVNYSTAGLRRVDMSVAVSYDVDIDRVRSLILDLMASDSRIRKDPSPDVVVTELAEGTVRLAARAWVHPDDYAGVYSDTLEAVKKRFAAEGIRNPYPQREVHLIQH